ncbi:MAG TPA: DMT family transporter [Thermoanaerobaculia bacterium]|nr:DMT family transporter [Thermoanaerobaculia bacterium]
MTAILDARVKTSAASTGWLLLAIPGVIWGASFLFIAEGLRAIGPNGVTLVRIAIGFATLALFPAAWQPMARRDWAAVALLGVVWFAFPLSMFPHAEERVSSAVTGMLNGAVPLCTAIVAAALTRRLPSKGVMTGLLVGMAGAVLIALPTIGEGRSSVVGVLLILAAVISYGFALSIAVPLQQRYGALPVIWRAQAVALILTAPLGLPDVLAAHWSLRSLLALGALGAFGTGIAFVLMTTIASRIGPTRASATAFLIPGVALLLGVVVLGERVALLSVIGCVVCVAGAWLMRRAQSVATPVAAPAPVPMAIRSGDCPLPGCQSHEKLAS